MNLYTVIVLEVFLIEVFLTLLTELADYKKGIKIMQPHTVDCIGSHRSQQYLGFYVYKVFISLLLDKSHMDRWVCIFYLFCYRVYIFFYPITYWLQCNKHS